MITRIAIAVLIVLMAGTAAQADPLYFALSEHSMAKLIGPCGEPQSKATHSARLIPWRYAGSRYGETTAHTRLNGAGTRRT